MAISVSVKAMRSPASVSLVLALLLLLLLSPIALMQGNPSYTVEALWSLIQADTITVDQLVVLELRLPRLLAAVLSGAALGLSGCLLQRLTGNVLASPAMLGLSQGAALGLVCLLLSPLPFVPLLSFTAAVVGAALMLALVLITCKFGRVSLGSPNLLLFGALLGTFVSSVTTCLLILDQHALDSIRFWLAGSLALVEWSQLWPQLLMTLAGLMLALLLIRPLQLLEMGAMTARSLGSRPLQTLLLVALAILLLTSAAVAVTGPILFLGLVVPQLARYLFGHKLWRQLLGSALLGALLLVLSDLLVRLIDSTDRLPPSAVLALIGVPWFIYLIKRREQR